MTRPLSPTELWELAKSRGEEVGPRPPEKVRKKRDNQESRDQQAVIKWWQANCRKFGVPEILLFAIPNGMRKGAIVGAILKREGVRKGAPDLMLSVPRGGRRAWHLTGLGAETTKPADFYGLFIEMKTRDGVVSPEQEVFHELLAKQGYRVVVCRSTMEAINQITTYLTA